MGLFSKKEKPISWPYNLVEQKADLKLDGHYTLTLEADHLHIKEFMTRDKNGERDLAYTRITSVFYGDETEISDEKKWVGRTVAGGLLFGGVGAIVGAATGGTKKKRKTRRFLIISFNDDNYLKFEDPAPCPKGERLPEELKKRLGIDDSIQWN